MTDRSSPAFCISAAILTCATLAALGGCRSAGSGLAGPREVSLAEFANAGASIQQREPVAPVEVADAEENRSPSEAAHPVRLEASGPDVDPRDLQRVQPHSPQHNQRRVIVDSLVGQVNGRPIFANEFFVPIEDQLRAIGRRVSQREFVMQARPIITEHLRQIVLNELFLAEARSQLTTEQQQGIFAWMRHIRDTTIAEGGGTRTATGQRLQDREGMTIEEYVAARRDMALLHQLRQEKIEPRVIVSWRDVQREYERRWDEFNPPATLNLARIRLTTASQADEIEKVKQRLESGESFAEIAAAVGQTEDGQLWQQFRVGAGGIAEIALADSIKQRIIDLEVGQTSEPFQQGASTWWLHIAGIEQAQGRDLYEVQRQIQTSLRSRRFNEEMSRYIDTLLEKGVYDEIDTMLVRLMEIAAVRYWQ